MKPCILLEFEVHNHIHGSLVFQWLQVPVAERERYNETTLKMFCDTWPTTSSLPQLFRHITAAAFLSTPLLGSFLPNKYSPRSRFHTFMYTWYYLINLSCWEAIVPNQWRNKDFVHVLAYRQCNDELCSTSWNKTIMFHFFKFFSIFFL